MYAVALDPGETTGICAVREETNPWQFEISEIGPALHHLQLLRFLIHWQPKLLIIESFENRGQDAAILASREYIGVAKLYVQSSGCAVVSQSSSIGKQFWDDEKLRKYGIYVPKLKHARDAMRHYLYYRTFKVGDQSLLRGDVQGTTSLIAMFQLRLETRSLRP